MTTVAATRPATESFSLVREATSFAMQQMVYKGGYFLPPAAFVAGDWTLTNPVTDGDLTVTISSLPSAYGTITDVEYRVDGGAWTSSGGIVTFTISGLTNGIEVDVELRAVSV